MASVTMLLGRRTLRARRGAGQHQRQHQRHDGKGAFQIELPFARSATLSLHSLLQWPRIAVAAHCTDRLLQWPSAVAAYCCGRILQWVPTVFQ